MAALGISQNKKTNDPIAFGEDLCDLRSRGKTQVMIANEIGVHRQMVGRYQRIGMWSEGVKRYISENRVYISNTDLLNTAMKFRGDRDTLEELRRIVMFKAEANRDESVPLKEKVLKSVDANEIKECLTASPAVEESKRFPHLMKVGGGGIIFLLILTLSYLMYRFQVSALEEMEGLSEYKEIISLSIQGLLLVLASLTFLGSPFHRFVAGLLFLSTSGASIFLLHRDAESSRISKFESISDKVALTSRSNRYLASLEAELSALEGERDTLLFLLDPQNDSSFVAKGESGNIRQAKKDLAFVKLKIPEIRDEIELKKSEFLSSGHNSDLFESKRSLAVSDSRLKFVLRVLIDLCIAFLVHVLLNLMLIEHKNSVLKIEDSINRRENSVLRRLRPKAINIKNMIQHIMFFQVRKILFARWISTV